MRQLRWPAQPGAGRESWSSPEPARWRWGAMSKGAWRGLAAGGTCSAMKAAHSTWCARRCGHRCGWRRAGARKPPLRAALLEATSSIDANQMLHRFYTPEWERSRVAALAPLVDRAAGEGDAAALHIVNQAAQELAVLAAAVRGQLWKPGEAVEIAYSGGVFKSRMLLERFRLLVEMEAGNKLDPPRHPPHLRALLEAYRSQVFLFRCLECAGSGLLEEQRTLHVRVPPRVQPGTVLEVPLEMFGISNLYLRVQVSISDAL